ncbi:hypothetical protein EV126DRAFT_216290 [Verticillium dahliae]|nr:hypothetical protein EV126DRAFT_216290 [Verticillium dahliae]
MLPEQGPDTPTEPAPPCPALDPNHEPVTAGLQLDDAGKPAASPPQLQEVRRWQRGGQGEAQGQNQRVSPALEQRMSGSRTQRCWCWCCNMLQRHLWAQPSQANYNSPPMTATSSSPPAVQPPAGNDEHGRWSRDKNTSRTPPLLDDGDTEPASGSRRIETRASGRRTEQAYARLVTLGYFFFPEVAWLSRREPGLLRPCVCVCVRLCV